MIENGLVKVSAAKIFGTTLLSGMTVFALGGMITWSLWKQSNISKNDETKETLQNFKTELDILTNEKRELLFQVSKLKEEFLELKKIAYNRFIMDVPTNNVVTQNEQSLDSLAVKKQELSLQIAKLQEKFVKLQQTMPANTTNFSKPNSNSSKLDMLKWVIEDNVELRKM